MNSASSAPHMGREKKGWFLLPLLLVCVLVPLCIATDSLLHFTLSAVAVGANWALLIDRDKGRFRTLRICLPPLLFPVLAGLVTRSASDAVLCLLLFAPALNELLLRGKKPIRVNTAYAGSCAVSLLLLVLGGILVLREGGHPVSPAGIREALAPQVSLFTEWVCTLEAEVLGAKGALFPEGQLEGLINFVIGLLPGFAVIWSLIVCFCASHLFRFAEYRLGHTEEKTVRVVRMSLFSALLITACAVALGLSDETTPSMVELLCANLLLCLLPGFALTGLCSLRRRLKRHAGGLSTLLLFAIPLFILFDPISSAVFAAAFGAISTIFRRLHLALRALMNGGGEDDGKD